MNCTDLKSHGADMDEHRHLELLIDETDKVSEEM